ncbi:MAG: Bax inhibitor-1/YccA family protein [Tissierellia bacterium]|nr:Bax inhibitor-1/YccA family protein [Tissierellia bacterium]
MLIRNPFFRKFQLAKDQKSSASYKGIAVKGLFFWVLCLTGLIAYYHFPISLENSPILLTGIILAVVCPLIAYIFPMTTSITGSVYSLLQGYLLGVVFDSYFQAYMGLMWLAIGITILVFTVLAFLYLRGIIKPNQKFKAVFLGLFLASLIGSAGIYASSFFTDILINFFHSHTMIAIGISVISLFLAIINLVFEFDFTLKLISKGAHKKYEWTAAYGLFMSMILIFIRIVEIIEKFTSRKDN